ncbi:MAG: polysaccharide biosynthesis C-terminal domain-containing protein, partial [Candidatus Heimdallarchaeota archaeon]|nr:polysaccharide biosynthesis C-terminal domain-containing protein [Candidatus Heimdallarchaeota archaeon]
FLAIGRPKHSTYNQFLTLIIMAILIIPLTLQFGMEGTALTVMVATLISTCVFVLYGINYLELPLSRWLFSVVIPLPNVLITFVSLWLISIFYPISSLLNIFTFGTLGLMAYTTGVLILDRIFNYGFVEIVSTNLRQMLSS